jgi:succinyl-CoA synthetase alpha subunit
MIKKTVVRKNRYFDSVFLMQVARRIAAEPGIKDASVLLCTEANKKVLVELGYGEAGRDTEFASAGPNDLVLALEGEKSAVMAVAADPETRLQRPASSGVGTTREPRSLAEAAALSPRSGVAVISVPGEHAARESRAALREGLNVFLFSSNVSVADEISLKIEARQKGLIVMGPDCGTAFIGGAGIGFANAVRRGPVGVVGSSGTGIQEFSCMVHRAGSGISHAIGTGSRDLSDAIGGISTMTAIDALEADRDTKVIAVISKPPGEGTTARLRERLARSTRPVVLCLLGAPRPHEPEKASGRLHEASTIDEAVSLALQAPGVGGATRRSLDPEAPRVEAALQVSRMRQGQRYVRGLFAGGTFCYQAQGIFRDAGLLVHSNSPVPGMRELEDPRTSRESSLVDMGAEIFVEGRPHPMIDASYRRKRLEEEGNDTSVALIILDFILGAISSRDPAGDLADTIRAAREAARRRGDHLCVAASVCGTEEDAQGLPTQMKKLLEAGALVFPSAAEAAVFAREVALELIRRKEAR